MVDLEGPTLTSEDQNVLQHPLVGGVILFKRNFQSLAQLVSLIQAIREGQKRPFLITVDHEGGRVQRFTEEFTILPPFGTYGLLYDRNPAQALKITESAGWLMASELLSVGIDLSFTPCLDLNWGISEVIGNRSFHHDYRVVAALGSAFIKGMQQAGMQATGKHFPGHGAVCADSHHELPYDKRSYEDIEINDLHPFALLAKNDLAAIMPAHIVYSHCDLMPAGFSVYWLQTVLRERLGFQGAIISDDLSMNGALTIGSYTQRALKALQAGCDMLLVCNNRLGVMEILENLSFEPNLESQNRLLKLCGQFNQNRADLYAHPMWQETCKVLQSFLVKDH